MDSPEPTGRRRLSRSRTQRLIFGVAGGLAQYFDTDPALVRIGFVLAALFPPLTPVSVLGYLLLTVILPEGDGEELPGREQFRRNLDSIRSDVSQMADSVRSSIDNVSGSRTPRQTVDLSDVEVTDVTVPSSSTASAATSPTASTAPAPSAVTPPAPVTPPATPPAPDAGVAPGVSPATRGTPPTG